MRKLCGKRRVWSSAEDDFIRANWQAMSDKKLARTLGRTEVAVGDRRARMGFHRPPPKRGPVKRDPALVERVRALWGQEYIADIAVALRISDRVVRRIAVEEGLPEHGMASRPRAGFARAGSSGPRGYSDAYLAECRATAPAAELALIEAMHREGVLRHA